MHNSGHFGPLLPFWAPGPPALPGLPMASYATGYGIPLLLTNTEICGVWRTAARYAVIVVARRDPRLLCKSDDNYDDDYLALASPHFARYAT